MSIPGLGQFAPAATSASSSSAAPALPPSTTQSLQPFWEYRFEVPHGSELTIKLAAGTAEKDGTELAPNTPYVFRGTKSKINTWQGCTLDISCSPSAPGAYEASVAQLQAHDTPLVSYLNLHMKLEGLRDATTRSGSGATGPRVLVVGPASSGKSSLVRMLTGWATRMHRQPLVVNTDPRESMLALPGSLTASVFATIIDPTTDWGGTPSSGPSPVPVKLPLAYYYGHQRPDDNPRLYKDLCSHLSGAATSRLAEDPSVRTAGILIDSPGAPPSSSPQLQQLHYEALAHTVAEFSVSVVVVLGSDRMTADLQSRFASQSTTLGEPITVLGLDRSSGVAERDEAFMQHAREATIRDYFFGDDRRTLSPSTQTVDFNAVTIWKVNAAAPASSASPKNETDSPGADDFYDPESVPTGNGGGYGDDGALERVEPSLDMQNCVLAVVYASTTGPMASGPMAEEAVREANVVGFVYVADVDERRRRLRVLAPVGARLGDRPLLWGPWPEPMVSLVG